MPHGDISARYKITDKYKGMTYDETQVVVMTKEEYLTFLHSDGQFCKVYMPFQALINPPTCTAALYAKNTRICKEIEGTIGNRSTMLTDCFHTPPTFPPVVVTSNLWFFISTHMTQESAITTICPDKATSSSPLHQPLHILKLLHAYSVTSRHFHLPPHYEDNAMTIHVTLERANLNSFNVSTPHFCIWQHIGSN